MLTEQQQEEMYRMVQEMYHNFGFDGSKPELLSSIQAEAKRKVAKWQAKQGNNERSTPT